MAVSVDVHVVSDRISKVCLVVDGILNECAELVVVQFAQQAIELRN